MKIIPAIDIIGGKCVRLSRGDYQTQQVYHEDPLAMARLFEDHGIRYLHLVDLDGARSRQIVNHKVLYEISSRTSLKIDFGGGIKSRQDLNIAFESGASQVTVGSIAAQQPALFLEWLHVYGADKIILGADGLKGRIATNGWQDTSSLDLVRFIADYVAQGVSTVICTDIDKDGMLRGPALDLYEEILAVTPVSLIASGGITSLQDLERLAAAGCAGAIIGKALYEQRISLKALAQLC